LYFTIEPLDEKIYKALESGELKVDKIRKKDQEVIDKFISFGMDRDEAKRVKAVFGSNLLVDQTRGIIHLGEILEYVLQSYRDNLESGPLAKEPISRVKLIINDAKLHEDAIHRGPAQVIPAVREGLRETFLQAKPTLLEPIQTIRIDSPEEYMGSVTKLVSSWFLVDSTFEIIPKDLETETIKRIRERKGIDINARIA